MGKTGALVLATCSGNIQRGPGLPPRERINGGEQISWHWPLLEPSDENYDRAHAVPKGWRVLIRDMGEQEWAERMEKEDQPIDDPMAVRYEGKELERNRGLAKVDAKFVKDAVDSLIDGDDAHWTKTGQPKVEAVAHFVEQYISEATDPPSVPVWPEWVNRKVIASANPRERKTG